MRFLGLVELLMAPAADVLEGLARLKTVLVTALLLASGVIEVHTYLIVTHVFLRNTIDVLLTLGRGWFGLTTTAGVLFPPLCEGVMLWNLLKS